MIGSRTAGSSRLVGWAEAQPLVRALLVTAAVALWAALGCSGVTSSEAEDSRLPLDLVGFIRVPDCGTAPEDECYAQCCALGGELECFGACDLAREREERRAERLEVVDRSPEVFSRSELCALFSSAEPSYVSASYWKCMLLGP